MIELVVIGSALVLVLGPLARLLYWVSLSQSTAGMIISLSAAMQTWRDYRLKRAMLLSKSNSDPELLEDYRDVADQGISQAMGGLLLHLILFLLGLLAITGPPTAPGREVRAFQFSLGFNAIQTAAIYLQLRVHSRRRRIQRRLTRRIFLRRQQSVQ